MIGSARESLPAEASCDRDGTLVVCLQYPARMEDAIEADAGLRVLTPEQRDVDNDGIDDAVLALTDKLTAFPGICLPKPGTFFVGEPVTNAGQPL